MTIGQRIAQRRRELGFTQDELARRIGYTSKSTIAKMETGANELRQSMIKKVADALETTPFYIMGWDEVDPHKPALSEKQKILIQKVESLSDPEVDAILTLLDHQSSR